VDEEGVKVLFQVEHMVAEAYLLGELAEVVDLLKLAALVAEVVLHLEGLEEAAVILGVVVAILEVEEENLVEVAMIQVEVVMNWVVLVACFLEVVVNEKYSMDIKAFHNQPLLKVEKVPF
jgi:hypothetical protein